MSDFAQLVGWLCTLVGGLAAVTVAWRLGLPRTLARDALHVGTGVWVLGWHGWDAPWVALVLPVGAVAGVALVPRISSGWARSLRDAVSGDDERWSGLVLYTVAFAAFTAVGLWWEPWPAAASLWALCLGDGLGGLVGRHLGRFRFRVPGGKAKSVEGSVTVAAGACIAAWLAGAWFGVPVGLALAVAVGIAGALAEAVAPRASDNLLVPVAVFLVAVAGR